jgi:predicted DNA-binding protein (UPF0251 family)
MLIIIIKMARPKKTRKIRCNPATYYFKPKGIPISELEEVSMSPDELEAIYLADLSGRFHENSASRMNISRATFGRILTSAHQKIADAIINGKAIKIMEKLPPSLKEKSKQFCKICGRNTINKLQDNICAKCLLNTRE